MSYFWSNYDGPRTKVFTIHPTVLLDILKYFLTQFPFKKTFQTKMGLSAAIIMHDLTCRLPFGRYSAWTWWNCACLSWLLFQLGNSNGLQTILLQSFAVPLGNPRQQSLWWYKTVDYLLGSFKINLDETPTISNFIKLWKMSFWWLFWRAIL